MSSTKSRTRIEAEAREERFTTDGLDGVHLRAIHRGDEAAPSLVLLHGAGANAHWWDHLAPTLARQFHVIALDFRGHGDSDYPSEHVPGAFSDDLEALLEHLDEPEAILMGHSMGAHVALWHAAQPRNTPALVLIELTRGASASRQRATRLALTLRRTYTSREQAIDKFRFLPGAAHATPELQRAIAGKSVCIDSSGRFGFKFDPHWFGVPGRRPPDLSSVSCPTLLLRGTDSNLLTPEGAADITAKIPDCKLIEIADAGHHAHVDQPMAVLETAMKFLSELREHRGSPKRTS
ncbi:MAG: alpha/beta hydrolase [bacterium]|nr:alpha/beta hydrolase [bacterium]